MKSDLYKGPIPPPTYVLGDDYHDRVITRIDVNDLNQQWKDIRT